MSKDFQRIEKGVNLVVGRPLTWLSYLTWVTCCWAFAKARQLGSWLRQRMAERKNPMVIRGKALNSPS